MITAKEFLATAALHGDEEERFLAALRAISSEADSCKRSYVGFPVKMPPQAITPNVAAAIRIHLRKEGWEVQCQSMMRQSTISRTAELDHWIVLVSPLEAENDAAVIRFKGREN